VVVLIATALSAAACSGQHPSNPSFYCELKGKDVVPTVSTDVIGDAEFVLNLRGTRLHYEVTAEEVRHLEEASLHMGSEGTNGPKVAELNVAFAETEQQLEGPFTGLVAEGTVDAASLEGPLEGKPLSVLISAIRGGSVYVQLATRQHPSGEVRGQLH
jgi:hypothetical protein